MVGVERRRRSSLSSLAIGGRDGGEGRGGRKNEEEDAGLEGGRGRGKGEGVRGEKRRGEGQGGERSARERQERGRRGRRGATVGGVASNPP